MLEKDCFRFGDFLRLQAMRGECDGILNTRERNLKVMTILKDGQDSPYEKCKKFL